MVKVRTKILFALLALMLLCSVQAIAAADGNDANLAIDADSDLIGEDLVEIPQADSTPDDEPGNVTVTLVWKMMSKDGPVNATDSSSFGNDTIWKVNMTKFDNKIANYAKFDYKGKTYVFTNWTDENGKVVNDTQEFTWAASDYTVTYTANYDTFDPSKITLVWNMENTKGPIASSESNTIGYNNSWSINKTAFDNRIANNAKFKTKDKTYIFSHWEYDNKTIITNYTHKFYGNGSDYTVNFNAVYDSYNASVITLKWNYMTNRGPRNETGETNTIHYNDSWGVGMAKFNNKIANYKEVDYKGQHYIFDHWEDENGTVINETQYLYGTGEDYVVPYFAKYNVFNSSTITAIWNMKNGQVSAKEINTVGYNGKWTITQTKFDNKIKNYKEFNYNGSHYIFNHWEDENGTTINDDQVLPWTGENYTVVYNAVYDEYPDVTVTVVWNMMSKKGPVNATESNTIRYGGSWSVTQTKFDNKIANYKEFNYEGNHYIFSHWEDENHTNVSGTQKFEWAEEDYTVNYYAVYDTYPDMTVTVVWNMKIGQVIVNETNTLSYGNSWTIKQSKFDNKIANYKEFDYDGTHYIFTEWIDENGTTVTGDQTFKWAPEDYTVNYIAVYEAFDDCTVTVVWNMRIGQVIVNETNNLTYGNSWTIKQSKFDNKIANNKEFDYDGTHYIFTEWIDENGTTVTSDQTFNWAPEDYTVNYIAVYEAFDDCTVTVIWNMMSKDGAVNATESNNLTYGNSWTVTQAKFDNKIANYKEFDYNGSHYVFRDWYDEDGNFVEGPQKFDWADRDYTVNYYANYDVYPDMTVTVVWNMMSRTGEVSTNESNTLGINDSWTVKQAKFDNKIANYKEFDYGTDHYVFDHWEDEEGNTVTGDQTFNWAEENYTVNYYAVYNTTPLEYLIIVDPATGCTGDIIDFTAHVTYINGTPVSGGKAVLTILYSSPKEALAYSEGSVLSAGDESYETQVDENGEAVFSNVKLGKPGTYPTVGVYTDDDGVSVENESTVDVLKLNTTITGEDASGKPAETRDIPAEILDQRGNPVKNGTATLTYNGKEYTGTVTDGNTVFKDVVLGNPGDYKAPIKYNGNDYYNPSNSTVNIHVDKLNTVPSAEDVSGKKGDKKDIPVTIVDENGNPVKNGTATLTVDGKSYTADVVDGVAIFKDVVLPDDDTVADVYYQGNEYYNSSSTTFNITIEAEPDNNETNETTDTPAEVVDTHATGNPIAVLLLVVIALVSDRAFNRKK